MILRFVDVTRRFSQGAVAVDRVSFGVPAGQFCVVIGASGAGKSTLLRTVNGLVRPTSGRVEFDGTAVEDRTLSRLRPRIAMVHQQFHLVPRLTVLRNVLAGALPEVSTLASMLAVFPRKHQRRACQLLAEVGLGEAYLYRRAMHLSGGEQQRVSIARAFMLEPDLVLADEPVASLDPQTSRAILQLLREASRQHGATVLCSLHQMDLASEFADRIVGMRAGRIVFDDVPQRFDSAAQQRIYSSADSESSRHAVPTDADQLSVERIAHE